MGFSLPFWATILLIWTLAINISIGVAAEGEEKHENVEEEVKVRSQEVINTDRQFPYEITETKKSDYREKQEGGQAGVAHDRASTTQRTPSTSSKSKKRERVKTDKEDSTNPPFPSQSSSFWEHEGDEGQRDYGAFEWLIFVDLKLFRSPFQLCIYSSHRDSFTN